jgi:glycerophosphoryl diester phosphodiesterase
MVYIIVLGVISLFIILYIYLISPDNNCDIRSFKKWHYAHRGLHNISRGIAENTVPAFEKAVRGNYGIELDVHLSKDNKVIVFHDDTLKRACGMDKQVSGMTYEEVKKYKLFNTDQHIPLLTDVLTLVSRKVPLIIEIKSCKRLQELCLSVSNLLMEYKGLFCIESFDPRIVKWFRINRRNVIRGQLSCRLSAKKNKISPLSAFAISHLLTNFSTRPNFIAYGHHDSSNLSFKICKRLLKANTVAWTIRSKGDMEEAKGLFDMFIFEGFTPQILTSKPEAFRVIKGCDK